VARIAQTLLVSQPDIPEKLPHAPLRNGPVVRTQAGRPADVEMMPWGIKLRWLPRPLIIARAETIAVKPSCRSAFETSRCLVIADSFYEWRGGNGTGETTEYCLPYDEPMVFAGIWARLPLSHGGSHEGYAILTTRANEVLSEKHERMPVILRPADWQRWLAPSSNPKELSYMMQPWTGTLVARTRRVELNLDE
jgi:putative SOS response-associated peptidase YedK